MSDRRVVRVGSRKSCLALAQTCQVIEKLQELHPSVKFEVVTMDTIGDKVLDVALSKIGDKNLFTKELETALVAKEVDFVVHSLKDMPTALSSEFVLACICQRIDRFDVAVFPAGASGKEKMTLGTLPKGSVIGTSAVRRVSQLQRRYPHLKFASVRGNLNTRLRKLDAADSEYAAIILAKAGLVRLGMAERIGEELDQDGYAVGQGALTCECRADDYRTRVLLSTIHDESSALTSICERSFMRELDGGCLTPIAVDAGLENDALSLRGIVMSVDGARAVEASVSRQLPRTCQFEPVVDVGSKRPSTQLAVAGNVPKRIRVERGVASHGDGFPRQSPVDMVFLGLVVHPICGPAVARMQTAVAIGKQLAAKVLEAGAAEILEEIRRQGLDGPYVPPPESRVNALLQRVSSV